MSFESRLQRRWYGKPDGLFFLWLSVFGPLEIIYRLITALRRRLYRWRVLSSWRAPVPVIVVGNIAVGGTGKTPLTIALCEALQRAGYKPGIVSRGYRARPPQFPYRVRGDDNPIQCGDEPLLIARRTRCPVVIAPKRADAARYLLADDSLEHCDVIICDDGLQHYALQRDIEIAVIDGARRFGNGHCLPCGPLRESVARLQQVDAIVVNGGSETGAGKNTEAPEYSLQLQPSAVVQLASAQSIPPRTWCKQNRRIHAVAGIGNPARFFASLRELGCDIIEHAFPDHHAFSADDLAFDDALPIVMTEKDAVKCSAFADRRHWYLQVRAQVPDSLAAAILAKLDTGFPSPPASLPEEGRERSH
jgi:tetraacyldisaccharide 4'-kinase